MAVHALHKEQNALVREATKGANMFITGAAGTGKSRVLRAIIDALPPSRTLVTAPTGVAALNVGGITLHSALGLKPQMEASALTKPLSVKTARRLLQCETLVLDEVSMLSPTLLEVSSDLCKRYRADARPFGGLQVIFCGDFLQLPPPVRDSSDFFAARSPSSSRADEDAPPLQKTHCFQTDTWDALQLVPGVLSQCHRQDDPSFVEFLHKARLGAFDWPFFEALAKTPQRETAVRLRCTNREVDAINARYYAALGGSGGDAAKQGGRRKDEERVYRSMVVSLQRGSTAAAAKAALGGVPEEVKLKPGTRVMLTRNVDLASGLINGTTGTVVGFTSLSSGWTPRDEEDDGDRAESKPLVEFDGGIGIRAVRRNPYEATLLGKVIGKVTQMPLRHAWAVTVHKAQGATLREVDLALGTAFDFGQAYVGLSRATSAAGLRCVGASPGKVKCCPTARAFQTSLRTANTR